MLDCFLAAVVRVAITALLMKFKFVVTVHIVLEHEIRLNHSSNKNDVLKLC